ncbi:MAG: hypothetical protein Q9212_002931 [Teloschistes hypoglaucus]
MERFTPVAPQHSTARPAGIVCHIPDEPGSPDRRLTRADSVNLKRRCPEGIYLALTPGDPTQWSGTFFVRKGRIHHRVEKKRADKIGPYAPAILRFTLSFPPEYPNSPVLITVLTDIFHPLVTPLTTYTYTSLSSSASVADEERLPPGGFSLLHAFSNHLLNRNQHTTSSTNSSSSVNGTQVKDHFLDGGTSSAPDTATETPADHQSRRESIFDILNYMKRAFDDEDFLNQLPEEAAASLGAWKAYQAHRRNACQRSNPHSDNVPDPSRRRDGPQQPQNHDWRRGEWNWDGVWEQRVKKGVDASISDQALFGTARDTEIVGFALHDDSSAADKTSTDPISGLAA